MAACYYTGNSLCLLWGSRVQRTMQGLWIAALAAMTGVVHGFLVSATCQECGPLWGIADGPWGREWV